MNAGAVAIDAVDGARHLPPGLKAERRRTARVRCQAPVQLKCPDGTFVGMCNDLSLGGMLFLGPLVSVGQEVKLSMDLSGFGSVHVEGEVVGHRDHPHGWGVAIRFASLTQHDLTVINRFVADRRG